MHKISTLAAVGIVLLLAGCAVPPDGETLDFDPFEEENRGVHGANKQLDRAVFGPFARGYGETVPHPVRRGITNLRDHWRLPAHSVQYVLQGRGGLAAESVARFTVNTVFGFAGLLDPATELQFPYRETDFDETFYAWGIPEGGYLEIPIGGPGTQRDWTGWALDLGLDPMNFVLPPQALNALLVVGGLDIVNDRYELDPVIEELLYQSSDSYTAQRITYLQNMRARLRGGTDVEDLEDIYEDF